MDAQQAAPDGPPPPTGAGPPSMGPSAPAPPPNDAAATPTTPPPPPSSASELLWTGLAAEGGPLLHIATFLTTAELPQLFAVNRLTASLGRSEALWRAAWPHTPPVGGALAPASPVDPAQPALPPLFAPTWRLAHRLVEGLYRHGQLTPAPAPAPGLGGDGGGDGWRVRPGADVTCPVYGHTHRGCGYSDGVVRVLDGGGGVRDYQLGRSSIRHMQLVCPPPDGAGAGAGGGGAPALFAGSWSGSVHAVDLATGGVSEVVGSLGGPVYGLRLSGSLLLTCCGDAAVYAWDASTRPAGWLATLAGHADAVTDFVVHPLPPAPTAACAAGAAAACDRRVVTASYDGSLRVWRLPAGAAPRRRGRPAPQGMALGAPPPCAAPAAPDAPAGGGAHLPSCHGGCGVGGGFTPAPGGGDASLCEAVLTGHRGPVWSVEASPSGLVYSSSADGTVRVWRLAYDGPGGGGAGGRGCAGRPALTATCVHVLSPYHPSAHRQLWCLRVAGDLVLAGASDGMVFCWRVPVREALRAGAAAAAAVPGGADAPGGAQPHAPLLWAYRAVPPGDRDGIRRLDLVRASLFTCTAKGRVGRFLFAPPGGEEEEPGTPDDSDAGWLGASAGAPQPPPPAGGEAVAPAGGAASASDALPATAPTTDFCDAECAVCAAATLPGVAVAGGGGGLAAALARLRGGELAVPTGAPSAAAGASAGAHDPRPSIDAGQPGSACGGFYDGGSSTGGGSAREGGEGGGAGAGSASTQRVRALSLGSLPSPGSGRSSRGVCAHALGGAPCRHHHGGGAGAQGDGGSSVGSGSSCHSDSGLGGSSSSGGAGGSRASRWDKGRPRLLPHVGGTGGGGASPTGAGTGSPPPSPRMAWEAAGAPAPHSRGGASCLSPLRFGSGPCANLHQH